LVLKQNQDSRLVILKKIFNSNFFNSLWNDGVYLD